MFAWNMLGISYNEYIATDISGIYLDAIMYFGLFIYLSWIPFFIKIRNKYLNFWTFGKIGTYLVTLLAQLVIIYIFSIVWDIVFCIVVAIVTFCLCNYCSVPKMYRGIKEGKTAVLDSVREKQKEEFIYMTNAQKKEFWSRIPPLEKMRVHVIPFAVVCGILPIIFIYFYFFVILK